MTTHNEEVKKFEILLNKHIVIAFSKQGQKSGRVLDSLHNSFQILWLSTQVRRNKEGIIVCLQKEKEPAHTISENSYIGLT